MQVQRQQDVNPLATQGSFRAEYLGVAQGDSSSDTFLRYVHKQIAHVAVGAAEEMAQTFPFSTWREQRRLVASTEVIFGQRT